MTAPPPVPFCVLVVAKAPIAGRVKTRLCPPLGPQQAADVAAAAFLDTLAAVEQAVDGDRTRIVVALDGGLAHAQRRLELARALRGCSVLPQRGSTFGERLAHAHRDAATRHPGAVILQLGMDTPQIDAIELRAAADTMKSTSTDAVLGPAVDGGWWLLGLRKACHADVLRDVPMSTAHTGSTTRAGLEQRGLVVGTTGAMQDVDHWTDAVAVASSHPDTRFAHAVRTVSP